MDDRSRVLTAACVGAVLGGLWGWLYLTTNGGTVRSHIGPALDRFTDEIKAAHATADKAGAALADARKLLDDVGNIRARA